LAVVNHMTKVKGIVVVDHYTLPRECTQVIGGVLLVSIVDHYTLPRECTQVIGGVLLVSLRSSLSLLSKYLLVCLE
jgi:hypothetical protein